MVLNPVKKIFRRVSEKAGLPPGTPVYVGEKKADRVGVTLMEFDAVNIIEKESDRLEDCLPTMGEAAISWINIEGLHDATMVERLCRNFGVHPLVIEDILNTHQRPKLDIFEDYIFIVLRMCAYADKAPKVEFEQVSILFGTNFVLTFQERRGDVFEPVRERLRTNKGRMRKSGTDYLAYALMDTLVDGYFLTLEGAGEEVESLEEELVTSPGPEVVRVIHSLKSRMILLRRSVWPLREIINSLSREDSPLIKDTTDIYFRDLYDHTIQVIDTVETVRDLVTGMLDIYLSSVSNRLNEIMKVLSIFATIFIPLTFIAGIYGMNFEFMPELRWKWGYFAVLALMASVGGILLLYFKKKKWF